MCISYLLIYSFILEEQRNGQKYPHRVRVPNKKTKEQLKKKTEKKIKRTRSNKRGGEINYGGIDRPLLKKERLKELGKTEAGREFHSREVE